MSEPAETVTRTQRFNEAVRDFKLPSPSRHAKLMPLKDGILELRQKGASLRLIRELLATVDVAVGTDTIARFLAEVNGEQRPHRSSKRSRRPRTVVPALPTAPPSIPKPARPAQTEAPSERSRIRGPRIADPHNL
jgi:hypothetical protein